MNSTTPRAAWFQVRLKTLFLLIFVIGAFFAGWSVAERQADRAVREAEQAAALAHRQAEQARQELAREWAAQQADRAIPCHPGCFPAGTPVRVPEGIAPVERIGQGDRVMTVGPDGRPSVGRVVSVFVTRNRLVTVQTDAGNLETTRTQPVCLTTGELRAAGTLRHGDVVWRWEGGSRKATTVRGVREGRMAQVFNLVLGDPTVFIAGDFLVRSKPPADD